MPPKAELGVEREHDQTVLLGKLWLWIELKRALRTQEPGQRSRYAPSRRTVSETAFHLPTPPSVDRRASGKTCRPDVVLQPPSR